jgi:hypothetical protein
MEEQSLTPMSGDGRWMVSGGQDGHGAGVGSSASEWRAPRVANRAALDQSLALTGDARWLVAGGEDGAVWI